jgi:ABC-type sulfate transport system permease component
VILIAASNRNVEVTSIQIFKLNESDAPTSAAALSVTLLAVSLLVLVGIRSFERWGAGGRAKPEPVTSEARPNEG